MRGSATPVALDMGVRTPASSASRKRPRPVGRPPKPTTTAIELREAMSAKGKLSQKMQKKVKSLDTDIDLLKGSVNPRGRQSSFERNSIALALMLGFKRDALKGGMVLHDTDTADMAGGYLGMTAHGTAEGIVSCYSLLKTWYDDGAVLVNEVERNGNRSYEEARTLCPDDIKFIDDWIESKHAKEGSVTVPSIMAALARPKQPEVEADSRSPCAGSRRRAQGADGAGAAEPVTEPEEGWGRGLTVKEHVVKYALKHFMGYSYSDVDSKKVERNEARPDIIRAYLLDLANAYELSETEDSDYIMVFTDESYIHSNSAPKMTWKKEGDRVPRTRSKGTRICILHAITKDGPLTHAADAAPASVRFTGTKAKTMHQVPPGTNDEYTCEYLFIGKNNTGDYHDMMNNKNFSEWVDTKLVPTFQKRYPGKKMILVLDNARYHHNIPLEPLGTMKKGLLIDYLIAKECYALTVNGTSYATRDDAFKGTASASNKGTATKEAIAKAALMWFRENKPDMLKSTLVTSFQARGWKVLFTPPYCPDLQPIELFWAAGKNWARFQNLAHLRSVSQCIDHLREGWYGGGEKGKEACDCNELWLHSLKEANKRVAHDDFLTGTIEGGLTVLQGCAMVTTPDVIGRATRMMGRYTADDLEGEASQRLTGQGVQGDACEQTDSVTTVEADNADEDAREYAAERGVVGWEVTEAPAAAAVTNHDGIGMADMLARSLEIQAQAQAALAPPPPP